MREQGLPGAADKMGTVRIKLTTSERGEGKMEAYMPQTQNFTLTFANPRGCPPAGLLSASCSRCKPCLGQHRPPAASAPAHLLPRTSCGNKNWAEPSLSPFSPALQTSTSSSRVLLTVPLSVSLFYVSWASSAHRLLVSVLAQLEVMIPSRSFRDCALCLTKASYVWSVAGLCLADLAHYKT